MTGIEIVSPEEAETADFVVCLRNGNPRPAPSLIDGECVDCGHKIFFAPSAPSKPPKVCVQCACDRVRGGKA